MYQWAPLGNGQIPRIYQPGQLIYLQGTEADLFYYLVAGSARSFLSSREGNERVLTTHHSGDLMGEASFFDCCPRVSSAVALTQCHVVSVSRQRLNAIILQQPDLAIPLLQYLARTVRLLSAHVNDISFRPAGERLARHLLALPPQADGLLHCTHEELGAAIGVSRVTVSRLIGQWRNQGALTVGYGTLHLSPTLLRTLALHGET